MALIRLTIHQRLSLGVLLALCSRLPVELGAGQVANARVVLARVTATGSRALVDLGPDDFAVDQAGRPREVLSVHMADYPIVVLVDDTAGADELGVIRSAAQRFISRVGQRAVAVGTLGSGDAMLATFDDGRADVLAKLGRAVLQRSGPLPLQSAANAARLIQATGTPFSAIVVLSSRTVDPALPVPGKLLNPILESGAAIHVVTHQPAPQGTTASAGDLLKALAEQTRGQYVVIYAAASYAVALDRLADRLATEVMVEYLATPEAGPGDVRVGVKIPGARVTGLGVSK